MRARTHTDTHTPVPYADGGVAARQVLRNPAGLDEALGDVPRVAQVNAAAAAATEECGRGRYDAYTFLAEACSMFDSSAS